MSVAKVQLRSPASEGALRRHGKRMPLTRLGTRQGNFEVAGGKGENAYCRALGGLRPPWETMSEWLEYAAVWVILKALGALPRSVARGAGGGRGARAVRGAAEAAADGGIQFAAGVSGVGRCAARGCDSRDGAQPGMDGGGVCALAAILEGEHRGGRDSRGP